MRVDLGSNVIKVLVKFCVKNRCEDDKRLDCVCFRKVGNELHIVGTDGNAMLVHKIELDGDVDIDDKDYIVDFHNAKLKGNVQIKCECGNMYCNGTKVDGGVYDRYKAYPKHESVLETDGKWETATKFEMFSSKNVKLFEEVFDMMGTPKVLGLKHKWEYDNNVVLMMPIVRI